MTNNEVRLTLFTDNFWFRCLHVARYRNLDDRKAEGIAVLGLVVPLTLTSFMAWWCVVKGIPFSRPIGGQRKE
jgi:hypothetical protein